MELVLWIGVPALLSLPVALAVGRGLRSAGQWDGSVARLIAADRRREDRAMRGLPRHAPAVVLPFPEPVQVSLRADTTSVTASA